MPESKEPSYAPGHELTLHPGDPVRGAELLEDVPPKDHQSPAQKREPSTADLADVAPRIYYT